MDDLTTALEALDRALAEHDATASESLLDADFVLVNAQPTPAAVSRSRFVDQIESGTLAAYTVERRLVDVDDDCGSALTRVRTSSGDGDGESEAMLVLSDVWRLRGGQWRLWRRHSTEETVAAPRDRTSRPAVASAPAKAATVSEVAAVLAALSEGHIHGPNAEELSPAEIQEYVEAFRALRLE